MAFENMEQAAEALAAANNLPESADSGQVVTGDAPGQQPYPNQPEQTPVQGDQGDQGEQFTPSRDIDLSGLPQEARDYITAREREMQAGFTRATQEAAQSRKEAEEALAFMQELNSNPDFAVQVVSHLSSQLQALGYSPAQADSMAAAQVGQVGAGDQPSEFGDDPYLAEIQRVEQRQARIEQALAAQEQQQRETLIESRLERMAADIQTANPSWNEKDMGRVFQMAYAYGGDLFRAAEDYKAIKQDTIEAYVNSKSSVPAGATPPPVTGSAVTPPEGFKDLNDPRLEAAATQMLRNALG